MTETWIFIKHRNKAGADMIKKEIISWSYSFLYSYIEIL